MLTFSPQQDYFDHWFFLQRMYIKIINFLFDLSHRKYYQSPSENTGIIPLFY